MWHKLSQYFSSKSTPIAPPMKSEDYEDILKRLTAVKTDLIVLQATVEAQGQSFKKLEGLYYAKLHEPKKKEEEPVKQEQNQSETKQAEPETLNPLTPPFWQ